MLFYRSSGNFIWLAKFFDFDHVFANAPLKFSMSVVMVRTVPSLLEVEFHERNLAEEGFRRDDDFLTRIRYIKSLYIENVIARIPSRIPYEISPNSTLELA